MYGLVPLRCGSAREPKRPGEARTAHPPASRREDSSREGPVWQALSGQKRSNTLAVELPPQARGPGTLIPSVSGCDRRRAVRAWGPRRGPLPRVQTLQGRPAEDGSLEEIKEKEKPSVRTASSSRRMAWAAHGTGRVPGRRSGHRVAGSARDGRGGPWPQASLGRSPERGIGSPGSNSTICQLGG